MYFGKNEVGQTYGKLVVMAKAGSLGRGVRWLCRCQCGNEKIVNGTDLRSGNTSSCGCVHRTYKDESGMRYGRYTVLRRMPSPESKSRSVYWFCRCDCGKEKAVRADTLRRGQALSCGQCSRPFLATKTGFSKHPLYHTWSNMIRRCYSEKNPAFADYGGRGVEVCAEWHSPEAFFQWIEENIGPRPEGYSLDRIDVFGNYEPGNLRWASAEEQVNNRRMVLLSEEEYSAVMEMRSRAQIARTAP